MNSTDTKTILFIGQESPHGESSMERLLNSNFFDIQAVVLAPLARWQVFREALAGEPVKHSALYALRFKRHLYKTRKLIAAIRPAARIFVVFDANKELSEVVGEFDYLVSVAYPQIFSQRLIRAPRKLAINLHASFLPRCQGAHPVYWTVASAEPFGGVTSHVMTEQLDKGPIVAQRKIDFDPDQVTYEILRVRVDDETPALIDATEHALRFGEVPTSQQGEHTYFRNDRDIHRRVYFQTESTAKISAKIRAGRAFCFTQCGAKIWCRAPVATGQSSSFVTNAYDAAIPPGTICGRPGFDTVVVRCKDGYITFKIARDAASRARRLAGWVAPGPDDDAALSAGRTLA